MAPKRISLALPRPQYVPQPEALISALAWKLLRVDPVENESGQSSEIPMEKDPGGKPIGLLYRTGGGTSKLVKIKATIPTGERLHRFTLELNKAGLQIAGAHEKLSAAVLNSLDGVRVEKSGSQPASPLSPTIALLQNMRGVLGTKGPPDVAGIIELMFALGAGTESSSLGASRLWLRASNHRMEVDPLLNALDVAVNHSVLGSPRQDPEALKGGLPTFIGDDASDYSGTPFDWFATSWLRLTSDEWVEALPARVWVDWATTILRLAIGLGYLWECSWNEAIARSVLKSGTESWDEIRSGVQTILPWRSSRSGKVALDVAPLLISRVNTSEEIRAIFTAWFALNGATEGDFDETMVLMSLDQGLRQRLTEALGSDSPSNSGVNLWEAIKYTLKTRETSEGQADYYGLLQSSGRYLTVNPGTEWIAVIASLSCGKPGASTDVGSLMTDFERMGMRPELSDLIALLERAGLARGSADADEGVIVESAF